jgi:CO/xanthine dehydrogenase FAD-binding subunit
MDALYNQVFFPQTLPELFSAWARFPDAVPFAGGGELLRNQGKPILRLPRNILSLDRLEEIRRITRTERYLEIGAMVKINEIIHLSKIVPAALTRSLEGIASPQMRNLITIGGNICHPLRRLDASAPMAALDARYELRSAAALRWISASRFSSLPGPLALDPQELLTRIRIPLEQWNYTIYRKLRDPHANERLEGGAVFIARIQKNILTDLRMVFAGEAILRDKYSETSLSGKQLPLDRREALQFVDLWKSYLSAVGTVEPLLRAKVLNFIETAILGLTD